MKIVGDDQTHKCHNTADIGAIGFRGYDALNCPTVGKMPKISKFFFNKIKNIRVCTTSVILFLEPSKRNEKNLVVLVSC